MEFYVLDTSFSKLAVVDTYNSYIWDERYSECGRYELQVPLSAAALSTLTNGRYLWMPESQSYMVVETAELKTFVDSADVLISTGRSLESILSRRIIWSQTTLTGNFQTGVKKLLDENAIAPTDSNRAIPGLTFKVSADPAVTGFTVDAQFTGDNLYSAVVQLCDSVGLGFRIRVTPAGGMEFELYSGVDRTYNQLLNPYVVFSPSFENLLNSTYLESSQMLKTVTRVGGEGEGSARRFAVSGSGAGLGRRELFTDARDISSVVNGVSIAPATYTAQLQQRGYEALAQNTFVAKFEGEAEPTAMYRYGVDFGLGDDIQLENEYGLTAQSRVTAYIRAFDSSGTRNIPTFTPIS